MSVEFSERVAQLKQFGRSQQNCVQYVDHAQCKVTIALVYKYTREHSINILWIQQDTHLSIIKFKIHLSFFLLKKKPNKIKSSLDDNRTLFVSQICVFSEQVE